MSSSADVLPLPGFIRFLIYGAQGICDELVFSVLLDNIVLGHSTLVGSSSVSSLLVFGICSLFIEQLYSLFHHRLHFHILLRLTLYLCLIYTWELCTGSILRMFDACPWDYSHYAFNFRGLITLEYAPGWIFLSFLHEYMSEYLLCSYCVKNIRVSSILNTTYIANPFIKGS